MYNTQSIMQTKALAYLEVFGPPSSPPIKHLLKINTMKHRTATIKKTKTENTRSPAGTV